MTQKTVNYSFEMIKDVIDLHVHGAPDSVPRKKQEIEIAEEALGKGMRALVFKSHNRSTIEGVNKINNQLGIEIAYPSLVLNRFIGFEPDLVKKEIERGVRIVYMPTTDSISHTKRGLSILENHRIKNDVDKILKLIAKHRIVLATGHIPNNEVVALVHRAQEIGIKKIVVTHPDLKINEIAFDLQQQLSEQGVYFERTFYSCINSNIPEEEVKEFIEERQRYSPRKLREIIRNIRKTGIENNILTSDLGQPDNLDPTTGFAFYLDKLKNAGLTSEELNIMAKVNPAKILGLYDFFVQEYVKNRVLIEEKNLTTKYREPVIGFSTANHQLFDKLKKIIRKSHSHPRDLLKNARTVVSIFLPFSEKVIKSNHIPEHASKEWAIAYTETNGLLDRISEDLAEQFQKIGFSAIGIKTTHHLSHAHKDRYDYDELFSDWSQRHIAYICGVGTFGVNNLIITQRGCAGRIGSLIVSADIKSTGVLEQEYCLVKRGEECSQCVKNCPVGVLKEDQFDRVGCMNHLIKEREHQEKIYKLVEGTQTCGKCATKIPCDIEIPR